jgi:hypothetical protein
MTKRAMSAREIQFYDVHTKKLEKSYKHKVRKFLEFDCIKKVDYSQFDVRPIQGYNSTTYKVTNNACLWACNCQGYVKRKTGTCSHIEAVKMWIQCQFDRENQGELF